MASKDKAPPPMRSRPPPDPPPFTIPPIPFESLTLTEPSEPPDPPDATFTFVLQVLDLESLASTMVLGTTSVVAPGVSTSREISSTSTVRSTLPLCTCFSDLSLQSSCVDVLIFSALELVSLGHVSCSDLENLVFSMAIQFQGLEYQLELYLSNSAIRALLVSLQDICVDMSVLVLLLAVLKPHSLQYAALRSLEDWTLDVDILVVVCFVDTAVLNVYNSDAFHHLASEFRVHLAQNLLSVSAYGVQLAHSRSQSQGKAKEANKVPFLHQDRVRQAPRSHPDAAWNKDKSTSGLGWVFSGSGQESPIHGSTVESFISSPLIAEAITIRSTLSMALILEFSTLKVLSVSLTFTRAISGNIQSKEIIGIVKSIRAISSGFATISFYHVSKSDNFVADGLAKRLSKPISLCNEHQIVLGSSLLLSLLMNYSVTKKKRTDVSFVHHRK